VQRAGAGGAVVGADGDDDLPPCGQGLQVVQLVEAAFLQRHDPAGQVGGVRLGRPGQLARRPGGRRRRGADIAPLPVGQGARPACCRPFPVAAAATRAA
jgi:hypothetical protein